MNSVCAKSGKKESDLFERLISTHSKLFFQSDCTYLNVQGPKFFSALHEELLILKSCSISNDSDRGHQPFGGGVEEKPADKVEMLLNEHKVDYEEYKGLQRSINANLDMGNLSTVERLCFKTRKMISDLTHKWLAMIKSTELHQRSKCNRKKDHNLPPETGMAASSEKKPFSQGWVLEAGNDPPELHLSLSPVQSIPLDENKPSTIVAYALDSSKFSCCSSKFLFYIFFVIYIEREIHRL